MVRWRRITEGCVEKKFEKAQLKVKVFWIGMLIRAYKSCLNVDTSNSVTVGSSYTLRACLGIQDLYNLRIKFMMGRGF